MEEKEQAAFTFLTIAAKALANRDECSIFGQMVASQLRNLSRDGQIAARHAIHNLLYQQKVKRLNLVTGEQTNKYRQLIAGLAFVLRITLTTVTAVLNARMSTRTILMRVRTQKVLFIRTVGNETFLKNVSEVIIIS